MTLGAAQTRRDGCTKTQTVHLVEAGPKLLGRLALFVFAGWFLLEMSLYFVPGELLGLSPWHTLRRPTRNSPFEPNTKLVDLAPKGELAERANIQPLEKREPITLETDDIGFRLTPGADGVAPQVMLYEGDSFTFGAALDQDDTLAAFLTRRLGRPVYNGGRFQEDPEEIRHWRWLKRQLGAHKPATVYVYLERYDLSLRKKGTAGIAQRVLGEDGYVTAREYYNIASFYYPWQARSPLRLIAMGWWRDLTNDKLLPNTNRSAIPERTLANGKRMLFEPHEIERYRNPVDDRTLWNTAEVIATTVKQFQAEGSKAMALLIPDRYTVYGPYVKGEGPMKSAAGLDRLEAMLKSAGVPVVNGLAVLRPQAENEVRSGEMSYFLEDHHWTPTGVRKMGEEVAKVLAK